MPAAHAEMIRAPQQTVRPRERAPSLIFGVNDRHALRRFVNDADDFALLSLLKTRHSVVVRQINDIVGRDHL